MALMVIMTPIALIWDNEILKPPKWLLHPDQNSTPAWGSVYASVQKPSLESLISMSEAVVVSFLHVVAGFFFHCLLLFLYSSTFMIFQCPLNQSTLFPFSFLTQTYPWLLISSPLQKSAVFSHSPFTPYLFPSPFHSLYFRNSLAAFLSIWIWPCSSSTSFLRARHTHISLLPEPWFSAVLPFSLIVFYTP